MNLYNKIFQLMTHPNSTYSIRFDDLFVKGAREDIAIWSSQNTMLQTKDVTLTSNISDVAI